MRFGSSQKSPDTFRYIPIHFRYIQKSPDTFPIHFRYISIHFCFDSF
jgi:hypothetical protein